MIIFSNIIPIYFFISFFIGLFFVYLSTPTPNIIIKYPTPDNAGKIVYKDESDVCYKYISKEVKCPSDSKKINIVDIQQ
tara:strand:+ start:203 stop:439 length:237 start_codon:yes stop_codon:yes gene_type:complete